MQSTFIKANSVRLECANWFAEFEKNSDEKPLYVLLHEGLGCVALWRDFPQQLANQCSVNVFAYSRAGYGRSDAITLPRSFHYMRDEARNTLPAIIDQLPGKRLRLLGHSDGASIALIYLAENPDPRIESAVLLAPHVFCESIAVDSIRMAQQKYRQSDLRQRLKKYHYENTDCAFRGWSEAWLSDEFRSWNISEVLHQIKSPLLLLQGQNDEYGSPEQLDIIAEQCSSSHCTVELMANCFHSPHFDQPALTLQRIREFNLEQNGD